MEIKTVHVIVDQHVHDCLETLWINCLLVLREVLFQIDSVSREYAGIFLLPIVDIHQGFKYQDIVVVYLPGLISEKQSEDLKNKGKIV